jgi:hypothetical protein
MRVRDVAIRQMIMFSQRSGDGFVWQADLPLITSTQATGQSRRKSASRFAHVAPRLARGLKSQKSPGVGGQPAPIFRCRGVTRRVFGLASGT